MANIEVAAIASKVLANIEKVIIGKRQQISLALVAYLCEGHILLEYFPGVAKTILARALARSVGCTFKRLQCTPDLLPTDVTGVSIGGRADEPGNNRHSTAIKAATNRFHMHRSYRGIAEGPSVRNTNQGGTISAWPPSCTTAAASIAALSSSPVASSRSQARAWRGPPPCRIGFSNRSVTPCLAEMTMTRSCSPPATIV
jgi:hypothetical protein